MNDLWESILPAVYPQCPDCGRRHGPNPKGEDLQFHRQVLWGWLPKSTEMVLESTPDEARYFWEALRAAHVPPPPLPDLFTLTHYHTPQVGAEDPDEARD